VSFAEVDYSDEKFSRAFGMDQGVGSGGWPTIRHYNLGTGYGGKAYKQKEPELDMDAELGKEERMREYVEEKGGASLCDVVWGDECSEMELKYIDKWCGPGVGRSSSLIQQEADKFHQDLINKRGSFSQNQHRISILNRIKRNFNNPDL